MLLLHPNGCPQRSQFSLLKGDFTSKSNLVLNPALLCALMECRTKTQLRQLFLAHTCDVSRGTSPHTFYNRVPLSSAGLIESFRQHKAVMGQSCQSRKRSQSQSRCKDILENPLASSRTAL